MTSLAHALTFVDLLDDGLVLSTRGRHHAGVEVAARAVEVDSEGGRLVDLQQAS